MERNELRELLDLLREKKVREFKSNDISIVFHDTSFFPEINEDLKEESLDPFMEELTKKYGVTHG